MRVFSCDHQTWDFKQWLLLLLRFILLNDLRFVWSPAPWFGVGLPFTASHWLCLLLAQLSQLNLMNTFNGFWSFQQKIRTWILLFSLNDAGIVRLHETTVLETAFLVVEVAMALA